MIQVMDRQFESAETARLEQFAATGLAGPDGLGGMGGLAPLLTSNDNISRLLPPGLGNSGQLGAMGGLLGMLSGTSLLAPLGGLMQQIGSLLQQIFGGGGTALPNDNEQYFSNARGASVGDPHLSFNGRTWNSMQSQSDLLHSDSIPGGYQVSTVTTPPNANGVTYNEQASVTTNNGQTCVSVDKGGNASIQENGTSYAMQPGATYDLGNGEIVSRGADGTVTVTCDNGNGGGITTTMRGNGTGVDVNTTANNVDLGGALVNGAMQPVPSPIPTPQPPPFPTPIRYEPLHRTLENQQVEFV